MPRIAKIALTALLFGVACASALATSVTKLGAVLVTSVTATASVTRSYVYDANQRLCKTVEPESGATVQAYDSANNIAWRASGVSLPGTTTCD